MSSLSPPPPGTPEQALILLQQQFQQHQQQTMQQQQQQQLQMEQLMIFNQRLQAQLNAVTEQKTADATPLEQKVKTISPAKPDTYNGSRRTPADVWIFGLETYFKATNISKSEQQINFAAAQLRESAATWWRRITHSNTPQTWEEFKAAFVKQFIPVASKETARATLHAMKQRNSVVGYCDAFTQCLLQLDTSDMSPDDQLFLFKRGLSKEISVHITIMRPKTLEEAMSLAQQVEIEMRNNARGNGQGLYRSQIPFQNRGPLGNNGNNAVAMELGNTHVEEEYYIEPEQAFPVQQQDNQTVNAMFGQQPRSQRRLSPEEVKEYMRRGVCFTCNKSGHLSRNCPSRAVKPQAQQQQQQSKNG